MQPTEFPNILSNAILFIILSKHTNGKYFRNICFTDSLTLYGKYSATQNAEMYSVLWQINLNTAQLRQLYRCKVF